MQNLELLMALVVTGVQFQSTLKKIPILSKLSIHLGGSDSNTDSSIE